MPIDVRTTSTELLTATFPKGIDLLLASQPMMTDHLHMSHMVHTPLGLDVVRHVLNLILHLPEKQPEGVGYI
jgi:hypothetical protein